VPNEKSRPKAAEEKNSSKHLNWWSQGESNP